jgi:hypothetical protein
MRGKTNYKFKIKLSVMGRLEKQNVRFPRWRVTLRQMKRKVFNPHRAVVGLNKPPVFEIKEKFHAATRAAGVKSIGLPSVSWSG